MGFRLYETSREHSVLPFGKTNCGELSSRAATLLVGLFTPCDIVPVGLSGAVQHAFVKYPLGIVAQTILEICNFPQPLEIGATHAAFAGLIGEPL
jgi:hypothetical protein